MNMARLVKYSKTSEQHRYRIFDERITYQKGKKKPGNVATKVKPMKWKQSRPRYLADDDSSESDKISRPQSSTTDITIIKSKIWRILISLEN